MNGPTNSDSGADVHDRVSQYYTDKVVTHGETPRGVERNPEESQSLNF